MRQRLFGLWRVLIGLHAMKISTRPVVDSCSLKGDHISAQGFNPGLRNSRRCALKGHHNPARHIDSFARVSSFSAAFRAHFCVTGTQG